MHEEAACLRSVLAAGGAGYLGKTASETEMMTAIRTAAHGRTFVDLSLA